MTGPNDLPSSVELRWPALVALDETAGPHQILDVLDGVCERLGISQEQQTIVAPDGSHPLVLVRLVEALTDLGNADAVEVTESGLAITVVGRRMTELDVIALPAAPPEEASEPEGDREPEDKHYILDLLEILLG